MNTVIEDHEHKYGINIAKNMNGDWVVIDSKIYSMDSSADKTYKSSLAAALSKLGIASGE